jgi:hypothetical protein
VELNCDLLKTIDMKNAGESIAILTSETLTHSFESEAKEVLKVN